MQSDKEPASQNGITIIPSSAQYAEQMEIMTGIVYDLDPRQDDSCFYADHFREHLNVFPEGQFIAIDTQTDTVIGLTVSMRYNFNSDRPTLEPWWHVIGYG
ncbi:MAG: hypothetical protein ABI690_03920 [Chloroflexota bacterium]